MLQFNAYQYNDLLKKQEYWHKTNNTSSSNGCISNTLLVTTP